MTDTPAELQILVGKDIPPEADFVFASTDRSGNRGALLEFVLKATGHGALERDPERLADGFVIVPGEDRPTLVIVVTVDQSGPTERLLRDNLRRALSAIAPDVRGRSLWLPLMGTGAGGLEARESFTATLDALMSSGLTEKGAPALIAFSGPPDLADSALVELQDDAVKMFGDRVVVPAPLESADPTDSTDIPQEAAESAPATATPAKRPRTKTKGATSRTDGRAPPAPRTIAAIQRHLTDLGFASGAADGRLGPATEDAIRRFQADENLPQTGEVESGLLKLLRQRAAEKLPEPERHHETAPFYPDHPAQADTLGREAIAEAIATIVHDVRRPPETMAGRDHDKTFMVHIHGRWGSGKTSILNFLREILVSGGEGEPWVVVDYNAWRNQGHGPAWWTMLNRVYTEAKEQLSKPARRKLVLHDTFWRVRSGWVPYTILAVMVIALGVIWAVSLANEFKDGVAIVASVVAVTAGVFGFGMTYGVGSARTAAKFLELARDPLRPLTRRYGAMIAEIGRPVAVFVDDLDRCDAKFVVELLQSIQTLYRRAPVLYVVAADRDWICCSYEQIYDSFREPIGEPGRPLGHLFLEKIFQLSITVPNLSTDSRRDFWSHLVDGKLSATPEESERIRELEEAEIEKLETEAEIRAYTEQILDNPLRRRIAGAQAFRRMQAAPLRTEREHFLTAYADLVEPNPRAMKRLVNAYGFKRGFELMAGLTSSPDAQVRWTIVELRWPELAVHLAQNPNDIALAGTASAGTGVRALLVDREVRRVTDGLTPALIRGVIGDIDDEMANEPAAA